MTLRSLLLLIILPRSLAAPAGFAFASSRASFVRNLGNGTRRRRSSSTLNVANKSSEGDGSSSLNVHWFRQTDLRLHDNPALCRTVELSLGEVEQKKQQPPPGILPVFVFDTTRIYGSDVRSELGSRKCGPRRAQFVLEAVADLRSNLERRGGGLVVAVGDPGKVLAGIAKASGSDRINVVCQEEVCSEELAVDEAVRSELAKSLSNGQRRFNFETVWGGTMYDPDSLPFDGDVTGISDTFTPFRNKVKKHCNL